MSSRTSDVRHPAVAVRAQRDDRHLAVDVAERHPPIRYPLVAAEVRRVRQPAREPIRDLKPRIGADQLAEAVPVAPVESIDVEVQQLRHGLRRRARRAGVLGQRRQLLPAATERRLHAAQCRVDELGNLLERVVEDVLQQHAGAFLRRQRDHQMLDRASEIRADRIGRRNEVGRHRRRLGFHLNAAPAQKIDAAIVGDAEQPRRQRPLVVEGVELAIGLEQRLLHDVLAVEHRSGHA